MWTEPTERYPEGRQDDTHLRVAGALTVAELVAEELGKLPLDLAEYIVLEE